MLQIEVLNAAMNKKEAVATLRLMQIVRITFCKVINTSWEKAIEKFPHYTKEDRLLSFTKDVPQPFMAYCQAAMCTEHQQCDDNLDSYVM